MNISITLIKSLAVNSAKNDTFLAGQVLKAADQKNIALAYHEAAGDDLYHIRMLERGFYTQAEKLKTWFEEYVTGTGNIADNPLVDTDEEYDTVRIMLQVSERFNLGFTKTLARLSQKYVEDRMIHLWWAPIDERKSAYYAKLAEEDLEGIRKCFAKTEPAPPQYCFPDTITLQFPLLTNSAMSSPATGIVPAETLLSNPYIIAVGEETEITYTISSASGKKPIDDIIVRADNGCCMPCLDNTGRWQVRGVNTGMTIITLFSRHDDRVFCAFALRVVPQ